MEIDYRENAVRQDPHEIRAMFDAIAPTYDRLNHILSFGLDIWWRRKAIRMLEEKRGGSFLDIAAGSGDLSLDALRLNPELLVASDFAMNMLNIFAGKLTVSDRKVIRLLRCDAMTLPFQDGSFDATMVGFGIRNFPDKLRALREIRRVLKQGGLSLVLELSVPRAPVAALLYRLHSRILLPFLGRIISRNNSAYRYLPESIAHFPTEEEFTSLMREAGFSDVRAVPLTFGAATMYVGKRH